MPLGRSVSLVEPRRRHPVLRVIALLIVLLIILAAVVIFLGPVWLKHAMRASLPQLDGQIHVPGLTAPVIVRRDHFGVPHIQAANLDDLFEAQGYVTAQDRLWEMDMSRRIAAGNVSQVLGSAYVKHDEMQRVLLIPQTAAKMLANFSPQDKRYLADYARGVNAYINTHRHDLPAEFRLLMYKPKPWTPYDSALVMMNMIQMMDERWDMKIDRGIVEAKLGPTLAAALYPVGSWRDHPPTEQPPDLSSPSNWVPLAPLDASQLSLLNGPSVKELIRLHKLVEGERTTCRGCAAGSNEWVVSGAHTASGMPILSNDMHLHHHIPNVWYEAGLDAPGFHATGVTLPGIPYIVAGHNEHIAWGFTAMYADMQDLYDVQINKKNHTYRAPGGAWKPLRYIRETIHVRRGFNRHIKIAVTGMGPIITQLIPHEKQMLALRWSAYDVQPNCLPLFALNTATDWSDFEAAMSRWEGPSLNVVYADSAGNIGYQAVGQIPDRPNGAMNVPITTPGHDWQGYIPFDQLPSSYNPPDGILATANSDITPKNYPYVISDDWADPYRNETIWKWLKAHNDLTQTDMLQLQTDVHSAVDRELAQRFAYAIDQAGNSTPQLRQAANILRVWDGNVGVNSSAAAIVYSAKKAFWPMLLRPRLGDEWKLYRWDESGFAMEQFITNTPADWLPPHYTNWHDFLVAVVAKGLENAPANLNGWRYGKIHRIDIQNPIYGMLPGFKNWTGTGSHPNPGDTTTVKQAGKNLGPSQRFTIDWANPGAATENIVTGESGDPLSPYYMNQWPYWYHGRTFVLPFDLTTIAAQAAHTLTLKP